MGASDLRSAFNSVARPKYDCNRATLSYSRHDGVESQILTFYGKRESGAPFEERSGPLRADADVNAAARAVAQSLLEKGD